MPDPDREHGFEARIAVAAALSVILHALAVGAIAWENTTSAAAIPPPPADRTPLGIRDSAAPTITWIGFREPVEQQARQSTLEQAAQQTGGGSPATRAAFEQLTRRAEAASQTAATALSAALRALQQIDLTTSDVPAEEPQPEPQPQPTETAAAQPAPEPAPNPGNAERESDAFSIEEPIKIQWGKPIAAEGLEILTTRKGPDFSAYTAVTARPKPLFVEIAFNPDGGVHAVKRLASSGNPDIDRPYLDVIYRWRARGQRIDALAPNETVKVRLRIIVHL